MKKKSPEKKAANASKKTKEWFSIEQKTKKGTALSHRAILLQDEVSTLSLMKLMANNPNEVFVLMKYVNTHRQMVRDMTAEELKEIQDFFRVLSVQSS